MITNVSPRPGRLAAFALALLLSTPAVADTCPMVSLRQVEAALPDYSPWTLRSGGTGACQFEGELHEDGSILVVNLHLLQQFHPTAKAAAEMLKTMRTEFAKVYRIRPLTLRGAEAGAFTYGDTGPGGALRGFWWYAQVGRAILSGMYMPPGNAEVDADEEVAVLSIVQAAVGDTAAPATAAKAAQCPHFDETVIRRLIPGKQVSVEQFGSNSCLAKNEKNAVVMFSRVDNVTATSAAQIAESTATGCTYEAVAALGQFGRIGYACTSGNKRASVNYHKAGAWYGFDLVTGSEPSLAQRQDLIELASRRYQRPD